MCSVTTTSLSSLSSRVSGLVVLPSDASYDDARRAWNLSVDQRPDAIVTPLDIDDIREIVVAASALGLGVAVQPNGHGAGDDLVGTILVRTSAFGELSIDGARRRARVGAGVNWGPVLRALDGTGLIALAGSNPEVNVVGYTINGGHSMFARSFGLAAHAVTAIEYVDADGRFLRADDASDAELMWAVRGGGGFFGVITAIEFDLFPAGELFGGKIVYPGVAAEAVVDAAFELAANDLSLAIDVGLMNFPDSPVVPEPLRGQTIASIDVLAHGQTSRAEEVVRRLHTVGPVISDSTATFTIGSLPAIAGEPTEPMPAIDWSTTLASLAPAEAEPLVAAFREAGPLLTRVGTRALGGAVATAEAGRGAIGALSAEGIIGAGVVAFDPAVAAEAPAAFAPLQAFAASRRGDRTIPTFLNGGEPLSAAYDAETIARLQQVARRLDPGELFRSNHPVR